MNALRQERPNILWIVSEDCPPWLGAYGDRVATTPHLDRLAERGTLFERAYSAAPVCAPSRFAMLTGVVPESHSPADRMRAVAPLPTWMRTYPELLREAGYYCTNNAKTDYNADVDADSIWDESSKSAHWRQRPEGSPFLAVFNFDATHESSVFDPDSPFGRAMSRFLAGGALPPQTTVDLADIRVPAFLPDTEEVRSDFARYYGFVERMDAFVGALLAQLEEDGLTDDTVVIHTSDHGGVTPRSKRYCYEEGLHVPLIVAAPPRWAHLFPPATVVAEPVTTVSIVPTLYALAGVSRPPYVEEPGLAECLDGSVPRYAFGARNRMDERYDLVRTVRSRRYRYLRNYTPHRPVAQHQGFAWNAAGFRSWETAHLDGTLSPEQEQWWHPKPPVELYDLDADPDEVVNLAGDPAVADVESDLRRRLTERTLRINDNGFLAEDSPHCGYDESRIPGAYPLPEVLGLADAGLEQDRANIPRFLAALDDADDTIRRWGAIGLLALAPDISEAVDALRGVIAAGPADVGIPAAEALVRATGDARAYAALAAWSGAEQPLWTRLEAINALTVLEPAAVSAHVDVVRDAAASPDEYLGNAGRYLEYRLDGTYSPDAEVFSVAGMLAALAPASPAATAREG